MGPRYAARQIFESVIPEGLLRINTSIVVEADMRHDMPPDVEDLTVRWATPGYLDTLKGPKDWLDDVRNDIADGNRVVTVEIDKTLIGLCQFSFDRIEQDSWLVYVMPPNTAWSSDARVAHESRGRGVYAMMHGLAAADLYREGYTHKLGEVDAHNIRMRQAIGKSGYYDLGRLFFVRILGCAYIRGPRFRKIGWWAFGRRCEIPLELFYDESGRPAKTTSP